MGYVYRYTDIDDGIIKYVGIVWSENRTLNQRIKEHSQNDVWCRDKEWEIEYICEDINSRTDAEYFEAHYISLYGTDKYFNERKSGWGVSSFLPNRENDWKKYDVAHRKVIPNKTISEIDMAKILTDKLFSLEDDKDRLNFGKSLCVKKNKNVIKSDEEYKYWMNVIDLIDKEVERRLFGKTLNNKNISVKVDGWGQINIYLNGVGNIVYYPNNNTFKISKNNKTIFVNKKEFLNYLDNVIEKIIMYKAIFI